jgi:hypothetical protein
MSGSTLRALEWTRLDSGAKSLSVLFAKKESGSGRRIGLPIGLLWTMAVGARTTTLKRTRATTEKPWRRGPKIRPGQDRVTGPCRHREGRQRARLDNHPRKQGLRQHVRLRLVYRSVLQPRNLDSFRCRQANDLHQATKSYRSNPNTVICLTLSAECRLVSNLLPCLPMRNLRRLELAFLICRRLK